MEIKSMILIYIKIKKENNPPRDNEKKKTYNENVSVGPSPRLDVAEKQVNWLKSTAGKCRQPPSLKNMK